LSTVEIRLVTMTCLMQCLVVGYSDANARRVAVITTLHVCYACYSFML